MSNEEKNELSQLTIQASFNDDIETLGKIYKVVLQNDDGMSNMGNEWFFSLLTGSQIAALTQE